MRYGDLSLSKSMALQERAKRLIPGMTQLLSKRPDRFSLGVWPGYFSRARGAEVWDLDGNRYLDMSIGGIGANVLGYADPDVDKAVISAIGNGVSCSLNCPEEVELAELLCELHPWAKKARFARTGGEAMTIAVRIARAYTGRERIAFCGYHGWHDWYLASNLSGEDALKGHLMEGLSPCGVPKRLAGTALPFRYNDLEGLEKIISENKNEIAAVVMEPIRSVEPRSGFLPGVMDIAKENNVVLVIDEISSGFRLNTGGAHLLFDMTPDMAVFSKALGNGYAIAAIIGKGQVMDAVQKTFVSSTNWTERVGPAAALAAIKKHRQLNVSERLKLTGTMIQKGWQRLAAQHKLPISISGIPPLSRFTFEAADGQSMKAFFIQRMLELGFLASNHYYAMYVHTERDVAAYLKAADSTFEDLAEAVEKDTLKDKILGRPATEGFERLA